MKYATETQQKKVYNGQPDLIDSLPIAIIENIWPKVEGEYSVTINKSHHGKIDTCKIRIKGISGITCTVGNLGYLVSNKIGISNITTLHIMNKYPMTILKISAMLSAGSLICRIKIQRNTIISNQVTSG